MKRTLAVTGVLSLGLFMAACAEDGADTTDSTDTVVQETTATATEEVTTTEETTADETTAEETTAEDTESAEPGAAEDDIVNTAAAAGSFNTLTTALEASGLDETLRGEGPFTVFAPTDEAFEALPEGALDELLADPQGELATVLEYHVVEGEVYAADVMEMDGQTVDTVQGGVFTVEVDGDQVVLVDTAGNRVNVTDTDVEASNGVIHVLDGVLSPTP